MEKTEGAITSLLSAGEIMETICYILSSLTVVRLRPSDHRFRLVLVEGGADKINM